LDNVCGRTGCGASAPTDENALTVCSGESILPLPRAAITVFGCTALVDVISLWKIFPATYEEDPTSLARRPSHSLLPAGHAHPRAHDSEDDGQEAVEVSGHAPRSFPMRS
jgi:hypothetical protein